MQFVDLQTQQKRIRRQIEANLKQVLDHGQYVLGPEVEQLENKLARYCRVDHAIGCASGTDALQMALMALDVGPGDAVFTTPFTFIATGGAIGLVGATPVFVDIDPRTYNIHPRQLKNAIEALKANNPDIHPLPSGASRLTPKTVITVNLFGLPADYDEINKIAQADDLWVIEDAAQSFGAEYKNQKSGSLGDIACTSFFPAKPLGAYGDGGMCFTSNDKLAANIHSIRVHGEGTGRYEHVRLGVNGRLDAFQAAVLLAKLELFEEELTLRHEAASRYSEMLAPLHNALTRPQIPDQYRTVWSQYSLQATGEVMRDHLRHALQAAGAPTAVYYPIPLHRQGTFGHLQYRDGDFPVSETISKRIFSLPMHPYLSRADQKQICQIMMESLKS